MWKKVKFIDYDGKEKTITVWCYKPRTDVNVYDLSSIAKFKKKLYEAKR